jgi:hypothetical protein
MLHAEGYKGNEGLHACVCGRQFLQPGPLKKHQGACTKSKKRLSSALEKAKQVWTHRKRRRLNAGETTAQLGEELLPGLMPTPTLAMEDVTEVRDNPTH